MGDQICSFFVHGIPRTKGSFKAVGRGRDTRLLNANPKEKEWVAAVGWAARAQMIGRAPVLGPIEIWVTFYMPRPLKPKHAWPSDCDEDKLLRSIQDAMTKIVYVDDRHVTDAHPRKRYAKYTDNIGARVCVAISDLDD